jgi:AbrB family looped-hinge helix DNA binding protein
MPPNSTISSKGQITIPLEIRRRLGLKEGDRVEFVAEVNGRSFVRPAQRRILSRNMPGRFLLFIPKPKSMGG